MRHRFFPTLLFCFRVSATLIGSDLRISGQSQVFHTSSVYQTADPVYRAVSSPEFSSAMGLLSIIRKIKRKEKEMRILMVGLDNSGKTTIVLKINGEDTSVISPTLGFNIKTISYHKYMLNIWDVGGQRTIRSYWRNYFEQTDGLVCNWFENWQRLSGASLLILANKQDIKGALTPDEIAKVLRTLVFTMNVYPYSESVLLNPTITSNHML
ncbi:ADP-ribosylation factor-like protein 2 [Linum perenne]